MKLRVENCNFVKQFHSPKLNVQACSKVLEHYCNHTNKPKYMVMVMGHLGTESTTEGLQGSTYASRPIRFGCCEDC